MMTPQAKTIRRKESHKTVVILTVKWDAGAWPSNLIQAISPNHQQAFKNDKAYCLHKHRSNYDRKKDLLYFIHGFLNELELNERAIKCHPRTFQCFICNSFFFGCFKNIALKEK